MSEEVPEERRPSGRRPAFWADKHIWKRLLKEGDPLPDDVVEQIASATGVSAESIRDSVERSRTERSRDSLARSAVVGCRVSASDLNAIDLLVETGVKSSRSEAAAWLISAGVQAQQGLLDELRSTVAEIRRLREQAQHRAERGANNG